MARAVQVRRVQVAAETDADADLKHTCWQMAQIAGVTKIRDWPKDFMEKFGGREQFLKREKQEAKT